MQEVVVSKKIHIASIVGLLVVAGAATIVVAELNDGVDQQINGDFRKAAVAEVHDAQGQVLLRGEFAPVDADDEGEIELVAPLTAVAAGLAAKGEAEVEYQTDTPAEQEVELTLSGLAQGTDIIFVIDGQRVATARADNRGRISLELAVRAGA
jgi:hypothetical protein